MRCSTTLLAIGLVFTGVASAIPTDDLDFYNFLSKRDIISPDNTCGITFAGANNSYTCTGITVPGGGPCCSQYGFCGNTTGMHSNLLMDTPLIRHVQTIARLVAKPAMVSVALRPLNPPTVTRSAERITTISSAAVDYVAVPMASAEIQQTIAE